MRHSPGAEPPRGHAGQPPRPMLPSDADSRDADQAGVRGGLEGGAIPGQKASTFRENSLLIWNKNSL